MPTLRVYSDDTIYAKIPTEAKREIAAQLKDRAAFILEEDPNGVEAFWMHPFEAECAVNTLPLWVDVEFSGIVTDEKLEELADGLLVIFNVSPHVPEVFGVRIKTPHKNLWKERG